MSNVAITAQFVAVIYVELSATQPCEFRVPTNKRACFARRDLDMGPWPSNIEISMKSSPEMHRTLMVYMDPVLYCK